MCNDYHSCCLSRTGHLQLTETSEQEHLSVWSVLSLWFMYLDQVLISDRLPKWRLAQSSLGTAFCLLQKPADKGLEKGRKVTRNTLKQGHLNQVTIKNVFLSNYSCRWCSMSCIHFRLLEDNLSFSWTSFCLFPISDAIPTHMRTNKADLHAGETRSGPGDGKEVKSKMLEIM